MNVDRLVREVEKRLEKLSESDRAEVLDALREEISRERRRLDVAGTVEAERERRIEAETLREILEAINRQARLEETIEEVLKQLARIVPYDSCSLALLDPDGRFRIIAAKGFPEDDRVVGRTFRDPLSEAVLESRWPFSVPDVQADKRFAGTPGREQIRSWAGIPLLVEGDVLGLLGLDRHRVAPFDEEELHRAKAVAFSAAAAIRKARLLEQVRRYATLMERVVAVDHAVFAGREPAAIALAILEGAVVLGNYPGGLLVLDDPSGPRVVAEVGTTAPAPDAPAGPAPAETLLAPRSAPAPFAARVISRLPAAVAKDLGEALGITLASDLYLVPLIASETWLGTLVLLDPNGETPDDRIMDAYASRAAAAYLHATRATR